MEETRQEALTHRQMAINGAAATREADAATTAASGAGWRVTWFPQLALAAAWVALATLLQVARQPGVPSVDTLWLEDGGLFLTDALNHPFLQTFTTAYQGYLHAVPRLLGWMTAQLPLEDAAIFMTGSAALIVSLLSVYIYWASRALVGSRWGRCLLAGILILLPAAGYEVNASVAALHWYLIFACFWALLAPWDTRPSIAVHALITAAAVFSDPMVGLFLPLVAFRLLRDRSGRSWIIPLVLGVGLVLQGVAHTTETLPDRYPATHVSDLPSVYALRVAASFLVGDRPLAFFFTHAGLPFAYGCALVVLLAVVALAFGQTRNRSRLLILLPLGYSALFLFVPLYLRGTVGFLDARAFTLNGSRYAIVPIFFLYTLFVMLIDRGTGRSLLRLPGLTTSAAFTAVTCVLILTNYSDFSGRTPGPAWRASLAAAHQRCLDYHGFPPDKVSPGNHPGTVIPHAGQAIIPTAPGVDPPLFSVVVDCDRIR